MSSGHSARGRARGTGRDAGSFVALPWSVLDSAAYQGLSNTAKALLLEVARQYRGDDNGRMLLSRAYLATRGWFSADAIQKSKAELLEAQLIFETVKGCRPNKASWYACTWWRLNKIVGYDAGVETAFIQGAYRFVQARKKRAAPKCTKPKKNGPLIPPHGTKSTRIVPPRGTNDMTTVPSGGAITAIRPPAPVPLHGNPLEVAISSSVLLGARSAR